MSKIKNLIAKVSTVAGKAITIKPDVDELPRLGRFYTKAILEMHRPSGKDITKYFAEEFSANRFSEDEFKKLTWLHLHSGGGNRDDSMDKFDAILSDGSYDPYDEFISCVLFANGFSKRSATSVALAKNIPYSNERQLKKETLEKSKQFIEKSGDDKLFNLFDRLDRYGMDDITKSIVNDRNEVSFWVPPKLRVKYKQWDNNRGIIKTLGQMENLLGSYIPPVPVVAQNQKMQQVIGKDKARVSVLIDRYDDMVPDVSIRIIKHLIENIRTAGQPELAPQGTKEDYLKSAGEFLDGVFGQLKDEEADKLFSAIKKAGFLSEFHLAVAGTMTGAALNNNMIKRFQVWKSNPDNMFEISYPFIEDQLKKAEYISQDTTEEDHQALKEKEPELLEALGVRNKFNLVDVRNIQDNLDYNWVRNTLFMSLVYSTDECRRGALLKDAKEEYNLAHVHDDEVFKKIKPAIEGTFKEAKVNRRNLLKQDRFATDLFDACNDYDLLPYLVFAINAKRTSFPDGTKEQLTKWTEGKDIDLDCLPAPKPIDSVSKLFDLNSENKYQTYFDLSKDNVIDLYYQCAGSAMPQMNLHPNDLTAMSSNALFMMREKDLSRFDETFVRNQLLLTLLRTNKSAFYDIALHLHPDKDVDTMKMVWLSQLTDVMKLSKDEDAMRHVFDTYQEHDLLPYLVQIVHSEYSAYTSSKKTLLAKWAEEQNIDLGNLPPAKPIKKITKIYKSKIEKINDLNNDELCKSSLYMASLHGRLKNTLPELRDDLLKEESSESFDAKNTFLGVLATNIGNTVNLGFIDNPEINGFEKASFLFRAFVLETSKFSYSYLESERPHLMKGYTKEETITRLRRVNKDRRKVLSVRKSHQYFQELYKHGLHTICDEQFNDNADFIGSKELRNKFNTWKNLPKTKEWMAENPPKYVLNNETSDSTADEEFFREFEEIIRTRNNAQNAEENSKAEQNVKAFYKRYGIEKTPYMNLTDKLASIGDSKIDDFMDREHPQALADSLTGKSSNRREHIIDIIGFVVLHNLKVQNAMYRAIGVPASMGITAQQENTQGGLDRLSEKDLDIIHEAVKTANYQDLIREIIVDGNILPESLLNHIIDGTVETPTPKQYSIADKQAFFNGITVDDFWKVFANDLEISDPQVQKTTLAIRDVENAHVGSSSRQYQVWRTISGFEGESLRKYEFLNSVFTATGRMDDYKKETSTFLNKGLKPETFFGNAYNHPKAASFLFEAAKRNNFIPELYYLMNVKDGFIPTEITDQFLEWAERKGLDVDQILDDYKLPKANNIDFIISVGYEARENQEPVIDVTKNIPENTGYSIAQKQAFFNNVELRVLRNTLGEIHSVTREESQPHISAIGSFYSNSKKIILSKTWNYIDTIEDDSMRRFQLLTSLSGCNKRATKEIITDYTTQNRDQYGFESEMWASALNHEPTRNNLFESAKKDSCIPELYFLLNVEDGYAPADMTEYLMAWCENNDVDLDQELFSYDLPQVDNLEELLIARKEEKETPSVGDDSNADIDKPEGFKVTDLYFSTIINRVTSWTIPAEHMKQIDGLSKRDKSTIKKSPLPEDINDETLNWDYKRYELFVVLAGYKNSWEQETSRLVGKPYKRSLWNYKKTRLKQILKTSDQYNKFFNDIKTADLLPFLKTILDANDNAFPQDAKQNFKRWARESDVNLNGLSEPAQIKQFDSVYADGFEPKVGLGKPSNDNDDIPDDLDFTPIDGLHVTAGGAEEPLAVDVKRKPKSEPSEREPVNHIPLIKEKLRNHLDIDGEIEVLGSMLAAKKIAKGEADYELKILQFKTTDGQLHQIATNNWLGSGTQIIKPPVEIDVTQAKLIDITELRENGSAWPIRHKTEDSYLEDIAHHCRTPKNELTPYLPKFYGWSNDRQIVEKSINTCAEFLRTTGRKIASNDKHPFECGALKGVTTPNRMFSSLDSMGFDDRDELYAFVFSEHPELEAHVGKPAVSAKNAFNEVADIIAETEMVPQLLLADDYEVCERPLAEISEFFSLSEKGCVTDWKPLMKDPMQKKIPANWNQFMIASGIAVRKDGALEPNWDHPELIKRRGEPKQRVA